jgi:hypothetical protein
MNNALKPHAMFGILLGLLLSIEMWCCVALMLIALT